MIGLVVLDLIVNVFFVLFGLICVVVVGIWGVIIVNKWIFFV